MYGHYGIEHNIQNIYRLAAPFVGDEQIATMKDLKPAYIRYLQSVHADFPIHLNANLVVQESNRIEKFAQAFSASRLNDLDQERMVGDCYSQELLMSNSALLLRAITKMKEVRPALSELFDLVVHAVILCRSSVNVEGSKAHGGTSNKCIGLIWLNLKPTMSVQDVLEMLIHELTHTLVFLDELNQQHFDYENLTKRPYWALSSILQRERPMDKVVHSILVSMEILYARDNYLLGYDDNALVHPNSESLRRSVAAAIESVLMHPNLTDVCRPRAIALVQNAKSQLFSRKGMTHAPSL